ncbi:uncharacterized protein LOC133110768 [Conger conger]|uniref:uncharacterized protein LOC133110768 n=1 Tax=Conger conger TaxID=82655 RepID=UPI002A59CBDA|nr:uncharacterized protein LOC133110768 [Conger conger]XP_061077051.1 uncharacterized protein LOC133110768 [Conger conger]
MQGSKFEWCGTVPGLRVDTDSHSLKHIPLRPCVEAVCSSTTFWADKWRESLFRPNALWSCAEPPGLRLSWPRFSQMKEGLLNHLASDRGPGKERRAAPPNETREHPETLKRARTESLTRQPAESLTKGRTGALSRQRTEARSRQPAESLTKERTEVLSRERTRALAREPPESLTKERTEALNRKRTESLSEEETDDSLDNGVEGTSEGSVQLGSKAPSFSADSDEHLPAAPGCPGDPTAPAGAREPPVDWLEPLEEDDDEEDDGQSWDLDLLPGLNGTGRAEESLAGESELSGSAAGSERFSRKGGKGDLVVQQTRRRRRKQSLVDEDWEDWPSLGAGWKRKEVFRRSGFSIGKTDTYYMSPLGDRLRSKVELAKHLAASLDLTTFDFKSGLFLVQGKMRKLKKFRKVSGPVRKRPSSPDSRGTPRRSSPSPQRSMGRPSSITTTPPRHIATPPRTAPSHLAMRPGPTPPLAPLGLSSAPQSPLCHGQRLRPLLKQEAGSPDCTQPELPAPACSRCGGPVGGTGFWRKRQTSLCLKCKGKRKYDPPNIIFRKWLPCGNCRACLRTEDCGLCASCRNGQLNHENNRPVRCRKRKCLCPIRKKTAKEKLAEKVKKLAKLDEPYIPSEVKKVKPISINKESESELIVCIDGPDEDGDKDEEEVKGCFRRPFVGRCGRCRGCLRSADCGCCNACVAAPRRTACGRARRPCLLRYCRRPAELVQHVVHEGWMGLGSPRPHYSKAFWDGWEFSEDEEVDEVAGAEVPGDYKLQQEADKDVSTSQNYFKADSRRIDIAKANALSEGLPDTSHSMSSVFSLAEGAQAVGEALVGEGAGVPWEPELQALLEAVRRMALPPYWVGLLAEGPSLQLVQCSKHSTMADTSLLIDSDFYYQISVQGQPLQLTHSLYRDHPRKLPTVAHVVALLLDLERHAVCQGYPAPGPRPPWGSQQPLLPTRAAICSFLVLQSVERCEHCSTGPQGP